MKPVLHLKLYRKWFDMIKSGEKKEEYRLFNKWRPRITNLADYGDYRGRQLFKMEGEDISHVVPLKIDGLLHNPKSVIICFTDIETDGNPKLYCKIKYMKIATFNYLKEEWGAELGELYFAFGLEVINNTEQTA